MKIRMVSPTSILSLILALGIVAQASGQQREDRPGIDWGIAWRIGGTLGAGPVTHSTTLSSLPGVPSCCPGYDGGSGLTMAGGPAFEFSLTDRLAINARLLLDRYSGTLETEEGAFVTAGRDTAEATFLHTIEENQLGLGLESLVNYRIVGEFRVMAGVRTGLMFAGNFHQEERILEPSSIRYENDLRTRMVYDGDLPEMNPTHFSVLAGFRYDLPLDPAGSFSLSPELLLWSSFSTVVDQRDWTMLGLRFGLSLYYNGYQQISSSPLDPLDM